MIDQRAVGAIADERTRVRIAHPTPASLVFATPFAAAALVPDNAYSAINALRNRY